MSDHTVIFDSINLKEQAVFSPSSLSRYSLEPITKIIFQMLRFLFEIIQIIQLDKHLERALKMF